MDRTSNQYDLINRKTFDAEIAKRDKHIDTLEKSLAEWRERHDQLAAWVSSFAAQEAASHASINEQLRYFVNADSVHNFAVRALRGHISDIERRRFVNRVRAGVTWLRLMRADARVWWSHRHDGMNDRCAHGVRLWRVCPECVEARLEAEEAETRAQLEAFGTVIQPGGAR